MSPRRAVLVVSLLLFAIAAAHAVNQSVAIAVSWILDANGSWETAANWSSDPALPGTDDDVTIDVGGSTIRTITHGAGTDTVRTLFDMEHLVITGGSLVVTDTANFGASGSDLKASGTGSMFSATNAANR